MNSAPRPRIEVEDLDVIEKRRSKTRRSSLWRALRGQTDDETRIYRELAGYARPYWPALVLALVMSNVGAALTVSQIFVITKVLEPIWNMGVVDPLASTLQLAADVLGTSGGPAAWGLGALGATSLAWTLLPPLTQLGLAVAVFMALVLAAEANKYAHKVIMRTVSLEVVSDVRCALFDRLMDLSVRFFIKNPSGHLLSRITHDLNMLGKAIVEVVVVSAQDAFTLLWLFIYLWIAGGSLVLGGILVGLLAFFPIARLSRRIRKKEHDTRKKMSTLFQTLSEVLQAQKIVKAFGAEDHERRRFRAVNDQWTESRKKAVTINARTAPLVEITGAVGVCALLWYGGTGVLEGRWNGPQFVAILMVIIKMVGSVRRLGELNNRVQAGMASADRVATVLYSEPEIVDREGADTLDGVHEGIVFDDVCYSYEPDEPVLRNISFTLPRERSLAIVGPTGAGKSTVGDLVPRFFDPDTGAVRIDGVDVRDYTVASLRRQIALVTQDTILFQGTLADNIAYAREDTPRDAIEQAARAAHAHDFITRLPEGYDTRVGERGMTLSGGERQRVAIARALLSGAPILILDEATAALDSQAEKVVQDALEALKQGRTTITIAHRLSTIRDADTILVLTRGEIAEQGSHDELLAAGGLYAQMWGMQTRG